MIGSYLCSGLEQDFIPNSTTCSSRTRTSPFSWWSRDNRSKPPGKKSTRTCGTVLRSSRPRIGRSAILPCRKRISSGSRIGIDSRFCSQEPRTSLITWGKRQWHRQRHCDSLESSSNPDANEFCCKIGAHNGGKQGIRRAFAGHKRPGNEDSPKIVEETRQYIRDFDRVAGATTTARGLYDKMLELYPGRVNPGGALWLSARGVKPWFNQANNHTVCRISTDKRPSRQYLISWRDADFSLPILIAARAALHRAACKTLVGPQSQNGRGLFCSSSPVRTEITAYPRQECRTGDRPRWAGGCNSAYFAPQCNRVRMQGIT